MPAGLRRDVAGGPGQQLPQPRQLAPGGVLVVGASASGVQIADELSRAGREVDLAVGRHTRMPRRYRGMDIFWWLERTGRLARTIDEVRRPGRRPPRAVAAAGRAHEPERSSPTSTWRPAGTRRPAAGRLEGVDGSARPVPATTSPTTSPPPTRRCTASSTRSTRYVERPALTVEVLARGPAAPGPSCPPAPTRLDLRAEGIGTVVVATGYRPHHPWLRLPIIDADGGIRQHRGVTAAPGVYVVGQRFQHRRDSAFIDGARHDAAHVVAHIVGPGRWSLDGRSTRSRRA